MKPSLRGATHLAPAYPAACVTTRPARAMLVLALILAATLPSSAGDRRRDQRPVGSVFAWGGGTDLTPTPVNLPGVVAVAGGEEHTLALRSDGTVWAWGGNSRGQLGDGSTTGSTTPVQVVRLANVVAIAAGTRFSVALGADGTVWAWGAGTQGQLGTGGDPYDSTTPVHVGGAAPIAHVVAISAGAQHALALTAYGDVLAWGGNTNGELGHNDGVAFSNVPAPVLVSAATPLADVVDITAGGWCDATAPNCAGHTLALRSDGTVWSWGSGAFGQLGRLPGNSNVAQAVPALSGVKAVAAGGFHSLVLKSDGSVWAFGRNGDGQLGNGGNSDAYAPVRVASPGDPGMGFGLDGITAIAAGTWHSVAMRNNGDVLTWGFNGAGQLGDGGTTSRNTPYVVIGLFGAVEIGAGRTFTLALQSESGGMAWGANVQGGLGTGDYMDRSSPVPVTTLTGLSAITGGWVHSVGLRSDGTVWAWGYNVNGELGDGTNVTRNTPGQVLGLKGIVAVASGVHHNVAVRADGTVWAWGANESGELGDGTTTTRSQPVQVRGPGGIGALTDIVSVACGAYHSVALKSDGTVWAWGANNDGQLGNPTAGYLSQRTPVQVMTGATAFSRVIAITAGYRFTLALRSDGTVWAWGENNNGEWGAGTIGGWSYVPVPSGVSAVVSISARTGFHSLALLSDGTVSAWGYNLYGELGNGSTSDSGTPVQVLGLSGVAAIEAGYEHSVARRGDGTVWAWGYNAAGQVGDGSTQDRTAPVAVSLRTPVGDIGAGGLDSFALVDVGSGLPGGTSLTITARDRTITYGETAVTLTFSVSPSVTLDTPPTCTTSAGTSPVVGTYEITCTGAAKTGYEITYVSGTLTVNQAPLTIIADNKVMGAGSLVPRLTVSYFGFVNGDTALTRPPTPTLPPGFDASVAGTYTIALDSVTDPNYSIVSANGQLTVNASALNFFNNFFVTGDYAVGSTSLQSGTGTITVAPPAGGDIPQGAHILAAFLYWQTVESATSAPASRIQFRTYPVLGAQQLGSDLAFTDGTLSGVLRTYRANVLPYLPVTLEGLSGTPVDVSTPADWANGSRHAIGASLVVVYRVLSNAVPLKAVVLYDGSWVPPGVSGAMTQDIKGFYEATPRTVGAATAIVATGTGWEQQTMLTPSLSGSDHIALTSENIAAGAAMVLSTPVNTDLDGLFATWKLEHGYHDARDDSWVDLPDAPQGGRELYVQIDYMCSLVAADGTCDTQNGHSHLPKLEALDEVAQAFRSHGVNVHFDVGNNYQDQPPHSFIVPAQFAKGGNVIPEETCVDTDHAHPQCVVPNEPGLVGWKLGLGLAKMGPRDSKACATTGSCEPRFQHGRKDSYHYALFAHSMAAPAWSFANGRLASISVVGDTATITTSVPHHLDDALSGGAPARITIAEAISQPYLNGIYVPTITGDNTFTIPVKNVAGTISSSTDPSLSIYSGKKSSSSGYSDVGGADTVISLGNWKFCLDGQGHVTNVCPDDTPQDDSLRVNVQAGTLMHELGHSVGLTHGGTYYNTSGTYLAMYEANCKPNYQSVMNYLFQIDLLGPNHDVVDYSAQALGGMSEAGGGDASAWTPIYSSTSWYSPTRLGTQSAATRRCDGSALGSNETMYRWDADVTSLAWTANQDVNFDGKHDDVLQGYDDWGAFDLRQIGATGSHFVEGGVLLPNGGGILLPNGGGIVLPNGGGVLLPDGSVVLPNGAGVLLPNGGGVQLPNGGGVLLADGGVLLPNGGGILLPNGGGVELANNGGTVLSTDHDVPLDGGGVLLANGGGVQLPNGGGIVLPNGGGVVLPNGGGVLLANGGGVLLANGGGVQLPNGGGVLLPNGGGILLPNGGGVQLPNGGGILLPNGGGIQLANGGGIQLPNGGGALLPNGGGILLPNGGGALLANGGGVLFPNGGGVTLPNGGGVLFPNGGGIQLPNGGGVLFPNGGGEELDYETANSFVRPPYALTKTQIEGGVRLDWQAPNFGVVSAYQIYRGDGTLACEVTGNPPPTTCPANDPSGADTIDTEYRAITIVPDENGQPRVSQPSEPAVLKVDQTIAFSALPNKLPSDPDFTVSATASSGLPVSFTGAGSCTVSGATVHLTGLGSCTITASQAGNSVYNPAANVSQTFAISAWTIDGFHSPVSMPENGTPVWNVVKGGSSVPLKFNIYAGTAEQTALSAVNGGSVALYSVSCASGATADVTGAVDSTGGTSLRYDGTQFIQNWKTPKQAGLCYAVRMTARDGSTITAYFMTK